MGERVYTVLLPFGGMGGGALGFQRARAALEQFGLRGRFRVLGGIEMDAGTAADFETLTGAPCLVMDVRHVTAALLREWFGEDAPDVVFFSPPCKGASGLLSPELAASPHYRAMNELAVAWVELMFEAWPSGPRVSLMENVPRIRTRAAATMRRVRAAHRERGYVVHNQAHNLGEIGGLAQSRSRELFIARRLDTTAAIIYQPPRRPLRTLADVLGALPLPGDPAAGPLHALPALDALTALRLALIPAGRDWKALPAEVWLPPELAAAVGPTRPSKRRPFNDVYRVARFDASAPCVTAGNTPSAGVLSVADPRVVVEPNCPHTYGVLRWDGTAHTITGNAAPGGGPFSVADPRLTCVLRPTSDAYGVLPWHGHAGTITAHACHDNGRYSVADPRWPSRVPFPVIFAEDGTWHRPLTLLERAALQSFPTVYNGQPLALAGRSREAWSIRIGDAVPPDAAEAIADQVLRALLLADAGTWVLSGDGAVWVEPAETAVH